MKQKLCIFITIAAIFLSACGGTKPAAQAISTSWPTKGWQTSTPDQQGMDAALLEKMQVKIRDEKILLDSLLIIRNGVIVSETYYSGNNQNTKHMMYSVTKSFISTLVGIALDQGKLKGIEQKALDLLPGRTFANSDARKQAMTLENLLTMSSGLGWVEGDPTYTKMATSTNWVNMVMDLPMVADTGKTFVYCSGCSHVLSAIIEEAAGGSTLDFAQKNLFQPLGITNMRWETDRQGIPIGGWGLNITPRDMAKLGYLYLHRGVWDGKQVVSSSWVQAATTRHIDTGGRLGYGYQWWIYPTHNAYVAQGRYGQTIFVAPDLDLIVVTTAAIEEGHDPIYDLIDNYILPAVKF